MIFAILADGQRHSFEHLLAFWLQLNEQFRPYPNLCRARKLDSSSDIISHCRIAAGSSLQFVWQLPLPVDSFFLTSRCNSSALKTRLAHGSWPLGLPGEIRFGKPLVLESCLHFFGDSGVDVYDLYDLDGPHICLGTQPCRKLLRAMTAFWHTLLCLAGVRQDASGRDAYLHVRAERWFSNRVPAGQPGPQAFSISGCGTRAACRI